MALRHQKPKIFDEVYLIWYQSNTRPEKVKKLVGVFTDQEKMIIYLDGMLKLVPMGHIYLMEPRQLNEVNLEHLEAWKET